MSIIQAHQLDIGVHPGQVPVFSNIGTLPLGADPVNELDAVTLRFLNQYVAQIKASSTNLDLSNIHHELTNLQSQISDINIVTNIDFIKQVDTLQEKLTELESIIFNIRLELTGPPMPGDLPTYKTYIKTTINKLVSNVRAKYISDTLGQSEVYREKVDQAIDYVLQRETVDIALYPLVRIDAEVFDITYYEAAENIIQQKKVWMQHTCRIEKLRLIVKREVDLAPSIDYINKLIEQFIIDLELI